MEAPIPLVEIQVIKVTDSTCLGINNEGYLRYDYYHEDLGRNDAVGATHVYNGYDSVLWNNFAEAFADEIQKTYSSWRSGDEPLLSYDNIIKHFITNQTDKWCISMYNEDAEYKYLSMYRNADDSSFLYQVKGTGEEHLKYIAKNRIMYCDSRWQAGDFVNKDTNTILLRLNSPDNIVDEAIKPDMNIKYRTFSNMYTGVRYGTNGVLSSIYTDRGELVEHRMPAGEDPNNLDTYIYGASEISELEDLSLLYANLINISAASKLTKLVVGNSHPNYKNDVLKSLSFSNNRLLREVNVCNCTGLTSTLDFSLCPDIQYIYATGSKISGVQLPDSGFIKKLYLPETTSNLMLVNQHHIEEFACEGYGNLTTIKIENSENVPLQDILLGCDSSVLASVSIKNINWNVDSEQNLQTIINKLIACHGSIIEGAVHLPNGVTVSNELKVAIHQNFPNLNVIDDNPVFYIDYFNFDNTIWDTETVKAGQDAVGPSKGNPSDIVQELQGLRHLFVQWKTLPKNVNKNYQIDATWNIQYAISFYNYDKTYIDTKWYDYGKKAENPSDINPVKEGTENIQYRFTRWDGMPDVVTKPVSVYALYDTYWAARFWNDSALYLTEWIIDGGKVVHPTEYFEDYTHPTRASTAQYDYHFDGWQGDWDTPITNIRTFRAIYTSTIRKYNVYFYNGDTLLQTVQNVQYGDSAHYTGSTPVKTGVEDPSEYVFKGWMPSPENITGETKCYPLFKFTGYLFGKLGEGSEYGTVDNPNWTKINQYWGTIKSDITSYKNGAMSEADFKNKYQIGGRMIIPIGTSTVADVEIIGYDHDNLSSGSGKATLTFFCKDLPNILMSMHSGGPGGWEGSAMREFTNGELYNTLPSELRSIIVPVLKISDGGWGSKTLITTTDKCWLGSYDEVSFASSRNNLPGQGEPYDSIFSDDHSRQKYIVDSTSAGGWWLRSSYYPTSTSNNNTMFYRVQMGGSSYSEIQTNTYYVAFGFCID